MVFEGYFVKFKRIKWLEANFRFLMILENFFHLIVVYEIFCTNGYCVV
jgi:hypothetical protein